MKSYRWQFRSYDAFECLKVADCVLSAILPYQKQKSPFHYVFRQCASELLSDFRHYLLACKHTCQEAYEYCDWFTAVVSCKPVLIFGFTLELSVKVGIVHVEVCLHLPNTYLQLYFIVCYVPTGFWRPNWAHFVKISHIREGKNGVPAYFGTKAKIWLYIGKTKQRRKVTNKPQILTVISSF